MPRSIVPALAVAVAVGVLAVVATGCPRSKPAPAAAKDGGTVATAADGAPAPAIDAATAITPTTWTTVRFVSRPAKSTAEGSKIQAYPDGRVVFDFKPWIAPSVAQAPAALIDKVTAWATSPREPGAPTATTEYVVIAAVTGATPSEATYDSEALPPETGAVYGALSALVNTPRTPLPCPAWDGSVFTLRLWSQNYGVGPGPIQRTEIDSLSLDARTATASGGVDAPFITSKRITLTAADVDAVRAALVAAKLGDYPDVFGGAGEGSNLRTISIATPTSTCSRSFTNNYDKGLDPVFAALADIRKRLGP